MRKFCLMFIITFCLFSLAFLFVGCGSSSGNIADKMSDSRYGVFDGTNGDYSATFIYGERENPYAPDGISNNKVNFGIISVVFSNKQTENEFNYTLKSDDKTFTGKIEKSPFTDEYLADIGTQLTSNSSIELTIEMPEENIIINLEKKSENWDIDYTRALKIGEEALQNEIAEMSKNGNMEYYLKIISNKTNFGTYFWAFTAISENGEKHTVVFSPFDKTILVKN